jgi:hypothetical protein
MFKKIILLAFIFSLIAFIQNGCKNDHLLNAPKDTKPPDYQFETTGEEFLISALDELQSITDYFEKNPGFSNANFNLESLSKTLPSSKHKLLFAKPNTDSIYIYGEVTPDGYGAVVTERHAYPKGILLITVRKSYGKPPTKMVTQTKRYITYADFLNDTTQQSNITEMYGLSYDTIVTHVTRNGVIETYTFRLPVINRVVNPQDGSIRVTIRYGAAGAIFSEVRDGDDNLIQVRETYGESDGAIITYTEYPDASWRNLRVIGQADGSVLRETTSGP